LITSDVRFVCSSSKDLIEEVRAKNLREDLFYALMRMPITLPPLRERGSDIIILAKHILNQYCIENNLEPKVLSSAACEKLLAYPFPGNIHELKSIIQFALVMSNAEQIEVSDLNLDEILLLQDGHCFRDGILNLCKNQDVAPANNFQIQSGSFETLIKLADEGLGLTLLPYLHTLDLKEDDKLKLKHFKDPKPAREISLIFPKTELKIQIIDALRQSISGVIRGAIAFQNVEIINPLPKK
jgi:DNA-binding NtrC family response regulator